MKFIISVLFSLILAFTAFSQSPSRVLKQAEKALGGTKALQAIQSVSKTGKITRVGDKATGRYASRTTQPNLINIDFELNGFEIETGSNGRSGWTRNSRDGLQSLTGTASVALQTKAAFRNNLWLNAKNEQWKLVSGGQTAIDGKAANAVIITTPKGVTIKVFFDAATSLPMRDEIPNGDATEIYDYADYKAVNGVQQAFANRVTLGDQIYEIRFDDIKANAQIARSEFDFPNLSGQALPDIPALLKELQANEDKVEALLDSYSYTQKDTSRVLGKDGVLRETETEIRQMSFYKGYRVDRQIEKNGKPLNEKEQANADKDAAKQVEEIEKKIAKETARQAKQGPNAESDENSRRVSVAEVLRASKLLNPRRERFHDRDVIVFDYEPNPAFDMKNAKSILKFFGKTAGVMWIDEKDKQVARLEAVLADNINIGGGVLAKLKKGAAFTIEKERVGNEIWLPSETSINLSVRVLLVKGIDLNHLIRAYDYRRFETEVKDAKLDGTKKP